MKITAQELKVGMTIKYGNQWGVIIEEPKQYKFKKNEVQILVKTLPQEIKRRDGYTDKYEGGYEAKFNYRKTTKVQTK